MGSCVKILPSGQFNKRVTPKIKQYETLHTVFLNKYHPANTYEGELNTQHKMNVSGHLMLW
jgi:hypothetical protein